MATRSSGTAIDPSLGFPGNFNPGDGLRDRYNTIGSRLPVHPRPRPGELAKAVLWAGQSVSANWGSGPFYTSTSPRALQINPLDGRVYPLEDPMFFADGTGSGPGACIGDALINAGKAQAVCVGNTCFGTTNSGQWADPNGNLLRGLLIAANALRAHGWVDGVHFYQQGEYEAATGTDPAVTFVTMLANIRAMVAAKLALGIEWPTYVALATFGYDWDTSDPNPANWTPGPIATAVRQAQAASWNGTTIRQGPDIDLIRGGIYRGGAHWGGTQAGPIACAAAWAAAV